MSTRTFFQRLVLACILGGIVFIANLPQPLKGIFWNQNLRCQQNLSGRQLAILELPAKRLPLLRPLFSRIAAAVGFDHSISLCSAWFLNIERRLHALQRAASHFAEFGR